MEIRKEIYNGSIKIFKNVKHAKKLCAYFQENILPKHTKLTAKDATHKNTEESVRAEACKEFENDPITSLLWKSIIDEIKVHGSINENKSTTIISDNNNNNNNNNDVNNKTAMSSPFAWDRVRLRIQQSGAGYDDITNSLNSFGRYSSTLPLHRDTWASQVMQQFNWWMPLLEIDENRTLAIYPEYFDKKVPNTTGVWSLEILKQKRKEKVPYPQLPQLLTEEMSEEEWMLLEKDKQPIVIKPGDVLIFSGNHLHGSVINNSGLTRFSSEIRTVDIYDVKNNIGAKNIDGYPHGYHLEWFHSVRDDGKKGMNLKKLV